MIVAEVSVLKLSWTAAATIGVLVTFSLFFMSVTDYRLLSVKKLNGWRKYVAGTSIIIFLGGFLSQAIYLAAGVISLTQPNHHSASAAAKHATQALFLTGAVVAIILAMLIFYRRLRILDVIQQHIDDEVNKEIADEKQNFTSN